MRGVSKSKQGAPEPAIDLDQSDRQKSPRPVLASQTNCRSSLHFDPGGDSLACQGQLVFEFSAS